MGIALALFPLISKAQTYSAWGVAVNETGHMYDSITNSGDELKFVFQNTPATAWGNARLVIYYEGNFGDYYDVLDVYDESPNYFGYTNETMNDCGPEDSTVFSILPAYINTWNANNSIEFTCYPNSGNGGCNFGRVRARLVYNYCLAGMPIAYATPSITSSALCASDPPSALTGLPAGGTFSGPGVSGSSFNPASLSPGVYVVAYTATDGQNCTTTGYLNVQIRTSPVVNNNNPVYVCNGNSTTLTASGGASFVWFTNATLTNSIASTPTYTTPALTQSTDYWVAAVSQNFGFSMSSINSSGSSVVDHNNLTGDDRSGIAVSKRHVYVVGDNNTARYDLNLTPASGVSLPIRDAIFSDLSTGKLWSLWNTTTTAAPGYNSPDFSVDAIRGLDSNLNFTNEFVYLSQVIDMAPYDAVSGIFAGMGHVGLYSGTDFNWYIIDITDGAVTNLGALNNSQLYGSENWACWGILESTCGGSYSAIFRNSNGNIISRRNLPAGNATNIGSFTNLSDMASITYNPWNSRWYFHHEYNGQFGGNSETLGYATASSNTVGCTGSGFGCPTKVTVNVPANATLDFPTAPICIADGPIPLTGGAPAGGNYTGIGVGTNASGTVFYPALAGVGTYTLTYTVNDNASGCTDAALKVVTVNECVGISEQSMTLGVSLFPNPNNGHFNYSVSSELQTLTITILDPQGREVYSTIENGLVAGTTKQINANLPSGIYFVKLSSGDHHQIQRMVIMK